MICFIKKTNSSYRKIILLLTTVVLLRCGTNEMTGNIFVGHWFSKDKIVEDKAVKLKEPLDLILYEDGILSFNGVKGYWLFSDWNMKVIRIEIPTSRWQSEMYELEISYFEEYKIWTGTMLYQDDNLLFIQKASGGTLGTFESIIKELNRPYGR